MSVKRRRPPRAKIWKQTLEHRGLAYLVAARWRKKTGIRTFTIDDLVNTALLSIYVALDRGGHDPAKGTISTYLTATIRNEFNVMAAKAGKPLTYPMNNYERKRPDHPPTGDLITVIDDDMAVRISRYAGPIERAERREDITRVRRALSRLSKYDRDLLTSLYGVGRPQRKLLQIARKRRIPKSTLRFHVERARLRLLRGLTKGE